MTEQKLTTRLIDESVLAGLEHYKSGPIEQTAIWGKFQDMNEGRKDLGVYGVYAGDELVAYAQATEISSGKYTYTWIKNGPVIVGETSVDSVVSVLKKEISNASDKSIFLRINTLDGFSAGSPALGFHISKTIILDTQPTTEEIVAQMPKKKVRYVGRRALADEALRVSVVHGSEERATDAVDRFYELWQTTAKHQSFGIHPKTYIQTMLEQLGDHCYIVEVTDDNGFMLAGAIATVWGDKGTYYYGARRNHEKSDDASLRAVIEAIKHAHDMGATKFDMLGVSEKEGDRLAGVTTFKRKFSVNVVDYPAAYDIPLSKSKYAALKTAFKVLKRKH